MSKREFLFQCEFNRYCVEHRAGKEGALEAKGLSVLIESLFAVGEVYVALGYSEAKLIPLLEIFIEGGHLKYAQRMAQQFSKYCYITSSKAALLEGLLKQVRVLTELLYAKEGNYPEFLDHDFPVPGPARDRACEQLGQAMRRHALAIQDIMRGKENTPPKKEKAGAVSKITALKSEALDQRKPAKVESKGLDAAS